MHKDRGAWIQTYTGRMFHYDDPQPSEIHILDIAQALSHLCRYAGHVNRFYSVAEHSVIVSRQFIHPTMRMIGLLHDATEAYCVDVPRPLKRRLPEYELYEDNLWKVIARTFDLPDVLPEEIHQVDTRMLMTERPQLFRQVIEWPRYEHIMPIPGVTLQCLSPGEARVEFLAEFADIQRMRGLAREHYVAEPGDGRAL